MSNVVHFWCEKTKIFSEVQLKTDISVDHLLDLMYLFLSREMQLAGITKLGDVVTTKLRVRMPDLIFLLTLI